MTKYTQDNETVSVECINQLGRFDVNETTFASIRGLHFTGCGGNTTNQVDRFVLEDTIFQGVEGRGTALVLNVVSTASIVRSAFISNTNGSRFKHHINFAALKDVSSGYGLLSSSISASADLTYSGALYIALAMSRLRILNLIGAEHKWVQLLQY